MFTALVLNRSDDDIVNSKLETLSNEQLNAATNGDVTVNVEYSGINYKDGLCITGQGNLVKTYPHVPGIDFAGTVESSDHPGYKAGDRVALTGWRVGEIMWGGLAQKARVNGNFLVPLPESISTIDAMTIGTAGITAVFSLVALEHQGLDPENAPVLVTGAAGGVGSVAIALLSSAGYEVTAISGRSEMTPWMESLGATQVLPRSALGEDKPRLLDKERWAACIDTVGGEMLSRVLTQVKYGGSVAAVGLAGGSKLSTTVVPFLLRGVNLLGIDSVMKPFEDRVAAWNRVTMTPGFTEKLETIRTIIPLTRASEFGEAILRGEVLGRAVVDVNA